MRVHNPGKECNNWNRSENRNQCTSGFKIIKFHRKIENSENRDCCEFPGMLRSEYRHLYLLDTHIPNSALGDSSTTRHGVNNIFQRNVRTCLHTHARTYEHSPARCKCSFGAIPFDLTMSAQFGKGIQQSQSICK